MAAATDTNYFKQVMGSVGRMASHCTSRICTHHQNCSIAMKVQICFVLWQQRNNAHQTISTLLPAAGLVLSERYTHIFQTFQTVAVVSLASRQSEWQPLKNSAA